MPALLPAHDVVVDRRRLAGRRIGDGLRGGCGRRGAAPGGVAGPAAGADRGDDRDEDEARAEMCSMANHRCSFVGWMQRRYERTDEARVGDTPTPSGPWAIPRHTAPPL